MSDEKTTMRHGDDPAEFTVDQVLAHLATADTVEYVRVLEAESVEHGGKGRKGILESLTEQDPDEVEPDEDGYTRVVVDGYPVAEPLASA